MIYLLIGAVLFIQVKSQPCDSRVNCTDPLLPACIRATPGLAGSCLDCETDLDCENRPGDETICEGYLCINATTTTMYEPTSVGECPFNCSLAGLFCDSLSGECVICRDDTDCQNSQFYGVPGGFGSTCGLYEGFGPLCETSCSRDIDCPFYLTPFCDSTGAYPGQCVRCNVDFDCYGDFGTDSKCSSQALCYVPTTTTPPMTTPFICNNDTECSDPTPYCMYGECSECKNDTSCGDGYLCEPASYGYECEPEPTTPADQVIGNVTCGDIVEGTLDSDNLAEYYRLTLDDIYDVVISTCNDGYFPTLTDTKLFLYDATGETEIYEDDDGGCGALSEIAEKLYARDYIIGVEPFASWYDGTYSLSITCSITTEAPINVPMVMDDIECGSLVNGSISFNDQNDYYYLMLNETTVVNVTTCTGYGDDLDLLDDTVLHIYDEWGNRLHENDNSGQCFQKSTIVEELDEGKYIIGVSSYDPFLSGDYYLLTACSDGGCAVDGDDCDDGLTCFDASSLPIDNFCYLLCEDPVTDCGSDDYICQSNSDAYDPAVVTTCFYAKEYTDDPTQEPTLEPTENPTSMEPTDSPSMEPTASPSMDPTDSPSMEPTDSPSMRPTDSPSMEPTDSPSIEPSMEPTMEPTDSPTMEPSQPPTSQPTKANLSSKEEESEEPDDVAGSAIFGGIIIMIIHALFI